MKTKRLLIKLAILAFLLVLCAFLGWGGYRLFLHNSMYGVIVVGLSIILLGWVFLSILHSLTKRSWFILFLFLMICGWGLVAYQPAVCSGSDPIASLITPLNKTLSIFFPMRGCIDDCEVTKTASYQLLYLCAYFFFALFMFSIFGRRIINSSSRFFVLYSNKNIFWGDSTGGRLLAQDILNSKLWQRPVFIISLDAKNDTEKEKSLFEKLDLMGAIVIYRNFDNIGRYTKGHRHFFLTENQDFNLKMALKVAENNRRQKLEIYLRTEMPRVDYLFRNMANIDLHILNQSSLVARQFVSEYPLIGIVPSEKINDLTVVFNFNILILGFSRKGRELLNKTICDAQFKGSNFAATVIDKNIDLKNSEFNLLFEECISEYNLSFMEDERIRNIGGKHFYQWFKDNHQRFERIIVALGDDAQNFNVSFALSNILIAQGEMNPQKKIFAHITHADKYLYCDYPLTMFGRLDMVYTCDIVIAQMMDQVAKAVNYVYSNYRNEIFTKIDWTEAEENWAKMNNKNSTFSKESSRAVALNVENIIKISGGRAGFDEMVKDTEMLEILAENEHLRWNAFHYTQGITRWNEIEDDSPNDAKLFMYSKEKTWLLKHACLVPYAELDRISERINMIREKLNAIETNGYEDYKEADRMIIRHFGLFYDILCQ